MFHALQTLAASAAMERAVLLANHVIAAEPVAQARLRGHAGRSMAVHLDGWPGLLPARPALAFRVTPAGLIEWCGAEPPAEPDLRVSIDASNPALLMARSLVGDKPAIAVAGDAAFATDVNWLFDNLRWDVEDDLARFVGAGPARELSRLGRSVAAALRESARSLGGLVDRVRRDDGTKPPSR